MSQTARGRRGSEILEFGLVMIPMFGFLFLTFDIAWAIFTYATLQNAVREGLRFAVTAQTESGLCQVDSVKDTVQKSALGMLGSSSSSPWWNAIHVDFLDPLSFHPSTNSGGNVVQVSIQGYTLPPLFPLFYTDSNGNPAQSMPQAQIVALSADVMQPSPSGGPPCM